jgi:hypothetical protein
MTRSRTQRLRLPRAGRRERAALRLESLEDRTLLDGSGQVVVNHPEAILRPTYGVQGPLPPEQPVPVVTPDGPQGGGGGGRLGPIPANVLVNDPTEDRSSPHDTQSETSLGLGPDNTLLVAYNDSFDNGHQRFTGYSLSNDGGSSFTDAHVLPRTTAGDAGDPVVARDNVTGRVYFATLAYTNSAMLNVFHSDDGIHFSAPVNGDPGHSGAFLDKEWLTVDNAAGAGQGTVYLVTRDFGGGNGIYLTRSTDQGLTFNTDWVQIVAATSSGNVQGAWVTVGPDHTVYAFWYDANTATQKIMMRKSTDQGHTFAPAVTVATLRTTGVNGDLSLGGFRSNAFPQAVVNPINNNLYVTFDDKGTGTDRADVFFTQSTDGGATWSPEVKVNDDTTTTDQWQPAIAVTPTGNDVGIFWYDRRNDPSNNLIDRYGSIGTIAGDTVVFGPNMRISDTSFPPAYGQDRAVNPVYMGDYDQVVATPTAFYTTWGDNRSPSLGHSGNNQDVRIAMIPVVVAGGAVVSSTPNGNTFGAVSSVRVTFDEQMDPTSFTPGQIDSFTAPDGSAIGISDVQPVAGSNNTAFDISFAQQTTLGHYTMVLGPDILDSQGREMDQNGNGIPGEVPDDAYTATFTLQGPKITASSPTTVYDINPISQIQVTFNEPMDPTTFTPTKIASFTGPNGAIAVTNVQPVAGSNNTQFTISFPAQNTDGTYMMVIGPDIRDTFGTPMDQDGDFIPGEIPNDQYTATFTVQAPPTLGPDGFGYTGSVIGGTPIDILNKPGTFTIIQDADDLSVPVDLGTHTFNFYGVNYTGNNRLYVSSNGLISFGVSDSAYVNTDLTTSPTEPVIAPLWADWDKLSTDPTGPMVIGKYITYNGSPALVIEWNQVQHYPGGSGFGHLTFQAVLTLDTGSTAGDFGFNYLNLASGDVWAEGNNATAGSKAGGSQGANRLLANFQGTSVFVHTGQALRFTIGASSPDVSAGGLLSARPDQLATAAPVAVPTAPGNLAPTPVAPSLVPVDQAFAAAASDQVPLALAAVGDDSLIVAAGLADALSASGAKDSGVL